MEIKDLKDARDRAACERAQNSGRNDTRKKYQGVTSDVKSYRANADRDRGKASPSLSQIDQTNSSRRVAFDENTEREFQKSAPASVRSDQSGWNVITRP